MGIGGKEGVRVNSDCMFIDANLAHHNSNIVFFTQSYLIECCNVREGVGEGKQRLNRSVWNHGYEPAQMWDS